MSGRLAGWLVMSGWWSTKRLMDSLSPGVRASYEGALLERDEAEYAAFVEGRMRRKMK